MTVASQIIRDSLPTDIPAITRIYNQYILHSTSTFEELPVTEEQIEQRMRKVTEGKPQSYPWLVAIDEGEITGYAYASPWKERSAYRFACETSVYLSPEHHGRGTGTALYHALLERLREQGLRTAVAVITLPNPGSVRLHERLGFEQAGHLKNIGFKFDQWLDTGFWQKELV